MREHLKSDLRACHVGCAHNLLRPIYPLFENPGIAPGNI